MNKHLYLYDCLSASTLSADGSFMTLGAGEKNSFQVQMKCEHAGSFAQRGEVCRFFPHGKISSYSFNGTLVQGDIEIPAETYCLFILESGCFICWYGDPSQSPHFDGFRPQEWHVYNPHDESWYGPYALSDLAHLAEELPEDSLATFPGPDNKAFYLRDIASAAAYAAELSEYAPPHDDHPEDHMPVQLRCPACWMTFSNGQELSIAAHPELRGDAIMGEDAMQRFTPEQWDECGLPVDAKGLSCSEYACPHCHHKLPPFFTSTHQHIISLVGVPAAGKTYYLASLVQQMETEFARDFGLPLRDADPLGNEPLNDMRLRLFTAGTPRDAYLGKTHIQGKLYQKVWRQGGYANMPRPFIYNLTKGKETHSIVLYDNAGEDYQPGRDSEKTPGSRHLTVANAILFLFDPTVNPGFRRLLQDHEDPQLRYNLYRPGRQAILLAESEMRLRTRLNLPPDEKLDIPMAVIIGKSDTWSHLLGAESLLPTVRNGMYMPGNVDHNSARLRQFVFNIAPNICANAEAISSNVRYFAVSSLGGSPVEITDEHSGAMLLAPASGQVRPFRVTDPLLWALHCDTPSLIPASQQ